MSTTLCKIQLLGGLRVQQGEREITRFRTQKAASLLAYLAYYRHQSHPREVLIEMLWPECDPKVGRSRLSNAFWALRRELESSGTPPGTLLQATHFAIGLNPAVVTTDVADFLAACRKATRTADLAERNQHLQEAVEAYSGELLPGFYEDWVLTEQQRLTELFKQVQRDLRSRAKQENTLGETSASPPQSALQPPGEMTSALPPTFTRFFGRTELLDALYQLLSPASPLPSRPRLVTITGAGGMGKTRLSLEVARSLLEDYSGSVWFLLLADLSDPGLIGSTLADALQLQRSGNVEPLEQAIAFLRERKDAPSLLVLDNFEQLVEGGAEIVQTLLQQVPALTCLVTSRRLLGLTHEQEIVLQPLLTPRGEVSPDHLTMYESVRLFLDRAKAVRPTFAVSNQNAPDLAELCYRLEGIPLAIELAAARAQVLTPAQIRSQLQQRFAFLVSRKRDVVARHQTLQAAIEWSYRLLAPELQRFFRQLSVFRGGWTLEAAEAVCEEANALEYLEQLREWSLLQVEENNQGIRFTMLETLREYGHEWLTEAKGESISRKHHADYFLSLAERAEQNLYGLEQGEWLARLEAEYDNLRAAMEYLRNDPKGGVMGLRLTGALDTYWYVRGHWREGRELLVTALSHPGAQAMTTERAYALNWAGVLASYQNDYTAGRTLLEEAITIRRENGDRRGVAGSLHNLGELLLDQGEYGQARALYEESLSINREMGNQDWEANNLNSLGRVASWLGDDASAKSFYEQGLVLYRSLGDLQGISIALNNLGANLSNQDDIRGALACYEEALAVGRSIGDKGGIAELLNNMGALVGEQGNYAEARACFAESLRLCQELGDRLSLGRGMRNMASLAQQVGAPERAVRLFGAAVTLREAIGAPLSPDEQLKQEAALTTLRASLGDEVFEREWEAGRAMTWEEAVAYALKDS
jgi:predicted ATPase